MILLVVASIQAVGIAKAIFGPESLDSATQVKPQEAAPSDTSMIDFKAIQQAELFGSLEEGPAQKTLPAKVKSRLDVKLLGLVKASQGSTSVAILTEAGRQRAYAVGDRLSGNGNAVLIEILADQVVLEVSGQLQYVELEKPAINDAKISIVATAPIQTSRLPQRIDLRQPDIHAVVGDAHRQLASDPLAFERYIQLQPYVEHGRLQGYWLSPGRDADLFDQVGLRNGDLLIHVDGIDITDSPNLSHLVKLVQAEERIRVGVRRGEQTQDIEINL
ncbi:type II secretion system protein GspC [Azotobacter armeniacus]